MTQIQRALEGMLFASGEAVEAKTLCEVLSCPRDRLETEAEALARAYVEEGRALRLIRIKDSLQLTTAPDLAEIIKRLVEPRQVRSLSQAAIETLSIIAYRQPVTRREIENIRGIKCDYTVATMLERGLIEVVGRSEGIGHPEMLGTTDEFLRVFALGSIDELPRLENISAQQLADIDVAQREEQLQFEQTQTPV